MPARPTPRATGDESPGPDTLTRSAMRPDGTLVLHLNGEYDVDTVVPLREALNRANADRVPHTVLDVSGVTFADSTLLNLFIQAHHRLARLVFAGPVPPQLQRLFNLTGVAEIFTFAPDVTAACADTSPA
ncbi:STAS domain-containing protein [Streptomyces sp. NPDC058674]|uniref:STAS domain-containing protein n=1 Tax=Streptomyces sp. NPDC058674 TaxID=3346592 RepID=UPI00364C0B88